MISASSAFAGPTWTEGDPGWSSWEQQSGATDIEGDLIRIQMNTGGARTYFWGGINESRIATVTPAAGVRVRGVRLCQSEDGGEGNEEGAWSTDWPDFQLNATMFIRIAGTTVHEWADNGPDHCGWVAGAGPTASATEIRAGVRMNADQELCLSDLGFITCYLRKSYFFDLQEVEYEDMQGPGAGGASLTCLGTSGNGWCRGAVRFAFTASDNAYFVGGSYAYVDGVAEITPGGWSGTGDRSVDYIPTGTGVYTFRGRQTASSGWAHNDVTSAISIDNTAPAVPSVTTIEAVVDGAPARILAASSTDSHSGVSGFAWSNCPSVSGAGGSTCTVVGPGVFAPAVRAVDQVGNHSAAQTVSLNISAPSSGGGTDGGGTGTGSGGALVYVDRAAATGARVTSVVRTTGSGRLAQAIRVRVGTKTRTICSRRAAAVQAGTYRLRCTIPARQLRRLRPGRYAAQARVEFVPESGSRAAATHRFTLRVR